MKPPDTERLLREHYASTSPAPSCDQTRALALYAAGELEPPARADLEAHLAACAYCREDLAAFGAQKPLWDRAAPAQPWWQRIRSPVTVGLGSALAAAAAILLVVVTRPEEATLRAKGGWQLHVAVERGGSVFRAGPGDKLQTGDRIGFFFSSEGPGQLALLSIDESGEVVRLFPTTGSFSAAVPGGPEVRLPDGAVVGDARGCEWIVGFFSKEPIAEPQARSILGAMTARRTGCRLEPPRTEGIDVQVLEMAR